MKITKKQLSLFNIVLLVIALIIYVLTKSDEVASIALIIAIASELAEDKIVTDEKLSKKD